MKTKHLSRKNHIFKNLLGSKKRLRKIRKQRFERGFADHDAWSGSSYLAFVTAGIMRWIVAEGYGVSPRYGDLLEDGTVDWSTPVDRLVERRDAEYAHIADIFERYSIGDIWERPEDAADFNGVTQEELREALDWFRDHFNDLWD